MKKEEWHGSRRTFLHLGMQTITAALLAQGSIERAGFKRKWARLAEQDAGLDYSVEPWPASVPPEIRGFYVNSPFIYLSEPLHTITKQDYPETWRQVINEADAMDANRIRLFCNYAVEPRLGEFNDNVINRISDFAEAAQRLSDGRIGVEVDLIDCYPIGNCLDWNPVYRNPAVTSPYNPTKDPWGYQNFFESRPMREAYWRRLEKIGTSLLKPKKPGVRVLTIANEPRPPKNGKEVNTEWMQAAVNVVREIDADIPLLSGVDRPWAFDEHRVLGLTGNTCHFYPLVIDSREVKQHIRNARYPLVGQEFGFPEKFLSVGIPNRIVDSLCSLFVKDLLEGTTNIDISNNKIYPGLIGIAGWKLDTYDDGFHFSEDVLPRTINTVKKWNKQMWQ